MNTTIKTVSALALKQELGRRRNNKQRRADNQPVVRTKAYYFGAFSRDEIKDLLDGKTVTKTYKSGRTESYVVA
jgi:hypothetical protein